MRINLYLEYQCRELVSVVRINGMGTLLTKRYSTYDTLCTGKSSITNESNVVFPFHTKIGTMTERTNGLLAPADSQLVQKIALLGPIGQALQESLQDMVHESLLKELHESDQEQGQVETTTEAVIDDTIADRILASFAKAVSDTKWHGGPKSPPSALLKGRVEYYNRFDGSWDITVADAELRPRVILDVNRKKRSRDRPSLWDVSLREQKETPSIKLEGTLQVLVYDDL